MNTAKGEFCSKIHLKKNLGMWRRRSEGKNDRLQRDWLQPCLSSKTERSFFDVITDLRMTNDFEGWIRNSTIFQKQDIIWLDFESITALESRNGDPPWLFLERICLQIVLWLSVLSLMTTTVGESGTAVPVSRRQVDGAVNPFQLYTFDWCECFKNNKNGHVMLSESRPTLPVHLEILTYHA